MGNLKLKDCSSMQEYLNKHELVRLDIIDSKGTFDDAQLVSKILLREMSTNAAPSSVQSICLTPPG